MTDSGQPPEPPELLLATAQRVVAPWLRRITTDAARRGGVDVDALAGLDAMVDRTATRTLDELADLLGRDVDDQQTNPLSVLRAAVDGPTELLLAHGVPARPADPFLVERFPDDVYGLGPAAWADIDDELHEPGIVWGAWKAMTVLRRRREEGRR